MRERFTKVFSPDLASLQPSIRRAIAACESQRERKLATRHQPIQKEKHDMRVTKASIEAAVINYAEMKKGPGETKEQALDRLAKNRDPLLIALYDEAQSAPADEAASAVAKAKPTSTRAEIEERIQTQTKAHVERGLTPEQAVARVLAEDPTLYDRWLELN